MNRFVVATPTDLDIREIVTLGLTTKYDAAKIGHKGSGLKFTLAFLHRIGGWMEITHPNYHLKSKTVKAAVRGHEHEFIVLEDQKRGGHLETHLTVLAGADTWKEPWFILRELIQNALDESGTFQVGNSSTNDARTVISVPMLPPLVDAWKSRHQWHLPRNGEIIRSDTGTRGIFYHGFRVYAPGEPWHAAYDVTDLLSRDQLSEDRQLRNLDLCGLFRDISLRGEFSDQIMDSYLEEPPHDLRMLFQGVWHQISGTQTEWGGPEGFSLHRLERAFLRKYGERAVFGTPGERTETATYYARAAGFEPVAVTHDLARLLCYSATLRPLSKCLPTLRDRLISVSRTDMAEAEKLKAAVRLTRKLRPDGSKIQVVDLKAIGDHVECKALAVPKENRILVLREALRLDVPELARLLIEEYAHLRSGADDFSSGMQKELVGMIYESLATHRRRAREF